MSWLRASVGIRKAIGASRGTILRQFLMEAVYAATGDEVQTVMERYGALAVLSLDGLMAVEIPASSALSIGQALVVGLSDGSEVPGRVESVNEDVAVVTFSDSFGSIGETAQLRTQDGAALGGGSVPGGSGGGLSGGMPSASAGGQKSASFSEQTTQTRYTLSETTILSVTPQETVTVSMTVDELDILSVRPGAEALVTLDALPGQSFSGVITAVNTTASNEGGHSKYSAVVELVRTPSMLSGMNASVRLTVESRDGVLLLPSEALTELDGKSAVYTAYDAKTETLAAPVTVVSGLPISKTATAFRAGSTPSLSQIASWSTPLSVMVGEETTFAP